MAKIGYFLSCEEWGPLESIRRYVDAGFDEMYVQQIGPEQEGFFGFYEEEILPKLR